jgi:archaetidylinositol phosphate synthase
MNVWRNRFHQWFAPLAQRCPLSPNALTVLALALNAVAAALFYTRHFLSAVAVLIAGGLLDVFDGIVARVQQKTSRFGDFLDHFCDRVSDTLLLTGWLLGNGVRTEITLASVIVVGLNGYIGTQLEATWHEREYDTVGRGEFVLALIVFPIVSFILFDNGWHELAPGGLEIAEWMALLLVLGGFAGIVQRLALARRLNRA